MTKTPRSFICSFAAARQQHWGPAVETIFTKVWCCLAAMVAHQPICRISLKIGVFSILIADRCGGGRSSLTSARFKHAKESDCTICGVFLGGNGKRLAHVCAQTRAAGRDKSHPKASQVVPRSPSGSKCRFIDRGPRGRRRLLSGPSTQSEQLFQTRALGPGQALLFTLFVRLRSNPLQSLDSLC